MTEPTTVENLRNSVIEEINRQATEENVQRLVEKKISEAIEYSINDAFKSWGEVGKQIDTAIKQSLQISDRMDIPSYGVMVMAVLRQKLDERVNTLISNRLDEEMNEILSIAPRELKFSSLVEAVVERASEDMADRYGSSITCIVEHRDSPYDWYEVWLDEAEDTEKSDCEIRFTVSRDGTVLSCHIDGRDPKKSVSMGAMWGYQKMLFGAYCCGSKIIMDNLDPATGIGDC